MLLNPHMGASGLPYICTFHPSHSVIELCLVYLMLVRTQIYLHVYKHLIVFDVLLYLVCDRSCRCSFDLWLEVIVHIAV